MYYNNMETRDPVLPSSCTAVFDWCIWIMHHDLPSCFMAFYSCSATFLCLFYFYECNEYDYIFQYSSVWGKCFSNMASEIHLRWFFFIKVEMMLLGAPSGTQNLPVFASLLGLLLTCITESAFLKIQYFKMLSPYCIFFMVFSSSVPLLLPSVSLCDVLTGVC